MITFLESLLSVFVSTVQAGAPTPIVDKYPRFSAPVTGNAPITSVNDAVGILVSVIDLAQVVFWITAAGFGLYGAYLYLFSQGSKESIGKAKNMMIYTVVAIILAIVAYGLPSIVINFIRVGSS